MLPEGLNRVLEFGCAGGTLGQKYKEANPGTVWHGIEIVENAAEYARHFLDEVWVLDANQLEFQPRMLEAKYDAIIYGDVIEHLIDPQKSLEEHVRLLKTGGELISCIPNIQHWTIIKDLLKGQWTYQEGGLLDKTHLRFFTRDSIYQMFGELGLEIIERKRFSHENSRLFGSRIAERDEILEVLELANKTLGQNHNELDFRTFQFGIRARKK